MYKDLNFPTAGDIPFNLRIEHEIRQTKYIKSGAETDHSGEFQECLSPIFIRNVDNLTQQKLGSIPVFSSSQSLDLLEDSLRSYSKGNGLWQKMSFEERIASVEKFLGLISFKREDLIKYLVWETGKNLTESILEFERTIEYTKHSIDSLRNLIDESSVKIADSGFEGKIRITPCGIVLCMGPSNYPFYETYSIVLPALLMGNNVLLKIPRSGALLHSFLFDAIIECFPAGVLNLLYGTIEESVLPLMESGKIDEFAYFGGSETAKQIIRSHAEPHRLNLVLGTEAKNPAVVMKDADLGVCAKEVMLGALAFNGQRCAALKMIFVHEDIYSSFMANILGLMSKIVVGMPWDENVRITPLSEVSRIEYLGELLSDALSKGAVIENADGGKTLETLFFPAILTNINSTMRIWHEEQFGPIVPIVQYSDPDEISDYLENQRFGQQISIFGNNREEIDLLSRKIENQVSRININCKCQRGPDVFPFSGKKDSGLGVLSIEETLRSFSHKTVIAGKTGTSIII